MAHKAYHETDLPDAADVDDSAFMHVTSKDTGAADTAEKRDAKGGPKSVY